jgi:hypothetical protein
MESVEYWNVKGQAVAAESLVWRLSACSELNRPMAYK